LFGHIGDIVLKKNYTKNWYGKHLFMAQNIKINKKVLKKGQNIPRLRRVKEFSYILKLLVL